MDEIDYNEKNAAALVYYGFNTKLRPRNILDYQRLIRMCKADRSFYDKVVLIAEGLSFKVIDVNEQDGIILGPEPGSTFAMTWTDYHHALGGELKNISIDTMQKRALIVLIHVAIAAAFFPSNSSVDDYEETELSATETQLFSTLQALCQGVMNNSAAVEEDDDVSPIYKRSAQFILDTVEVDPSTKHATYNSVRGVIQKVLKHLEENSLVIMEKTSEGCSYFPTPRYRKFVYQRVAGTIYEILLDILAVQQEKEVH